MENGQDIFSYNDAVSYLRIVNKYSGYAAISLLVSNVKKPITSVDDQRIYVTGKNIVAFPKVKGFTIKRNGTEIATVEAVREYVDQGGNENDTYTVEVKYEDGIYTGCKDIPTDSENLYNGWSASEVGSSASEYRFYRRRAFRQLHRGTRRLLWTQNATHYPIRIGKSFDIRFS